MPLTPLVDEMNPCYCPRTSATDYLESVRSRRLPGLMHTFNRLLDQGSDIVIEHEDSLSLPHYSYQGSQPIKHQMSSDIVDSDSVLAHHRRPSVLSVQSLLRRRASSGHDSDSDISTNTASLPTQPSSSSYLAKDANARSSMNIEDGSYELDGPADPIDSFFPRHTGHSSSPTFDQAQFPVFWRQGRLETTYVTWLEDELFGPMIGLETPQALLALIARLETIMPGIRLRQRLEALDPPLHQSIVDTLGNGGLINERTLELFRSSEIWHLDLSTSMQVDESGLNLASPDILKVLAKPHSFQCLTELTLNNIPLNDLDLLYIHHLPRLDTLSLNNTNISNGSLYHLVSLRRTLAYLHIEENPLINDDAIPPLLALSRLRFVSLIDTDIQMPGLRRFALAIRAGRRRVDFIVPHQCELYFRRLQFEYLLEIEPPLITHPHEVDTLTVALLRKNLAAHAAVNGNIMAGGTKMEMAMRLRALLERREADFAVQDMLWTEDEDEEVIRRVKEEDDTEMSMEI